ncbi:MAG TPA: hypothetical protein VMW66_06250 [Elusimicrobiales bacterium]|nr:hypothetical protein [Elusimicrobiales bacterium]
MTVKTIYVDCPHCGARIEAESKSGKVMQSWEKPQIKKGEDAFKQAFKKQKEDKSKLDEYFKGASGEMEKRKKDLLDKFDKAKKEIHDKKDYGRPDMPTDLD